MVFLEYKILFKKQGCGSGSGPGPFWSDPDSDPDPDPIGALAMKSCINKEKIF